METQKQTQSLTTRASGNENSVVVFEKPANLASIRTDPNRYPHYRTGAENQRKKWLAGQISTLASLMRIKDYTADDALAAATSLDWQIMRHQFISDFTLVEISESFRRGLYGEYGEWHGLTVQSLWGFLQKSLVSPVRQEAINMIYAQKREEAARVEQEKIRAEIEKAKADGTFTPTGRIPAIGIDVNAPEVLTEEETERHRNAVRAQARAILAHAITPDSTTYPNSSKINW